MVEFKWRGKWGVLLMLLFFSNVPGFGQGYKSAAEIGIYGGGSYYIGDINPNKHFRYSKPTLGLVYRHNLSTRHAFRVTAFYGSVYGEDASSSDPVQINRNLNFRSDLLELGIGYEVNLLKYRIKDMKYPWSPYFFYQIAYTRMNPVTDYNGNEVALQPLGTEGQGTSASTKGKYGLNQLTVPLGVGVKINLRKRLAVSFEYGIRKTFTDYLDDVSGNYADTDIIRAENGPLASDLSDRRIQSTDNLNRGNPANKDWYAFYGVMITFKPFERDVCEFNTGGIKY